MPRITRFVAAAIVAVSIGVAVPAIWALEKGGQRAAPRAPAPHAQQQKPPANPPPARPPGGGGHAVPRQPPSGAQPHAVPREGPRPFAYPYYHSYYHPYMWTPFYYGAPYAPWYYTWGYAYPPYGYPYAITPYGSIRLEIDQRQASVLVDGFYAGVVDDFDGVFQRLDLTPGYHRVEVGAPGYETLSFEVNVVAGQSITYKQKMMPILP